MKWEHSQNTVSKNRKQQRVREMTSKSLFEILQKVEEIQGSRRTSIYDSKSLKFIESKRGSKLWLEGSLISGARSRLIARFCMWISWIIWLIISIGAHKKSDLLRFKLCRWINDFYRENFARSRRGMFKGSISGPEVFPMIYFFALYFAASYWQRICLPFHSVKFISRDLFTLHLKSLRSSKLNISFDKICIFLCFKVS